MLKKPGRREPGGLAGIQKQMFWEVTWSNFEPWRWTGRKTRQMERISNEEQNLTLRGDQNAG